MISDQLECDESAAYHKAVRETHRVRGMNTAQSPILGTGKNILIPVVSYTKLIPKKKMLFSLVLQQANSVGGDETRQDISFSKIQAILLKAWSKRTWTVLAPEWFIDYVHGGLSMNLRSRLAYAPAPRINIWITPSAGSLVISQDDINGV